MDNSISNIPHVRMREVSKYSFYWSMSLEIHIDKNRQYGAVQLSPPRGLFNQIHP